MKRSGPEIICERCGTSFHVKQSRADRHQVRFCSRECRTTSSDPKYFWNRVDVKGPNECWPWTKATSRTQGRYGQVHFDGAVRQAHAVAFKLTHGFYTEYHRHTCDNGICCNPAHLLDGTHQDNMNDKVERGRQPRGETAGVAKLTEVQVIAIRADARPNIEIAADYDVHASHISRIKGRKIWRHI